MSRIFIVKIQVTGWICLSPAKVYFYSDVSLVVRQIRMGQFFTWLYLQNINQDRQMCCLASSSSAYPPCWDFKAVNFTSRYLIFYPRVHDLPFLSSNVLKSFNTFTTFCRTANRIIDSNLLIVQSLHLWFSKKNQSFFSLNFWHYFNLKSVFLNFSQKSPVCFCKTAHFNFSIIY